MSHLPYTLRGEVTEGFRQSRLIGLPTANIHPAAPLEVEEGSYAGRTKLHGKPESFPSLIFYGTPRSLPGAQEARVEVYLLHESVDLYGKELSVTFEKFLRPNEKFEDEQLLLAAIRNDYLQAQNYFSPV